VSVESNEGEEIVLTVEKAVQQAITKRQEQQEQRSPESSFEVETEKPRILAA
jgi:hypothetical protein